MVLGTLTTGTREGLQKPASREATARALNGRAWEERRDERPDPDVQRETGGEALNDSLGLFSPTPSAAPAVVNDALLGTELGMTCEASHCRQKFIEGA